jgi:DNA gyrase/topoisomerase IV subunit B
VIYNKESFKYKNGLDDIISKMNSPYFKFSHQIGDKIFEFFIVFDINKDENEQIFTWLNSSLLFDGGSCNTQFLNAFTDKVINHLAKEAKKQKCKVTRNDVKDKLLIFGNIKISDPEFDSQAKTRLVGPSLRTEMNELISESWNSFSRKNKEWFEEVLKNAHRRHHSKADSSAIKDHLKVNRKRVEGFKDATSKNRPECSCLITEGLSAAAEIQSCRDPKTIASFALTGKINNVFGATPAQLLKMGKITNMLSVLGLTPGIKATPANLNFGKICISVDSDVDGSHIMGLLVNIFYQFWPEIFKFEKPMVYRLLAPLLVAINKKERVYFSSMEEFNKVENKYKNYNVVYYKGLGSMERCDWVEILNNLEDYLLPITYDKHFDETHDMLFSDDVQPRKDWLT